MTTIKTVVGDEAGRAIAHPDLEPPPRPQQFGAGATADLRDAMARFAPAEDHAPRRNAVLDALQAIDLAEVTRAAAAAMTELLKDTSVDIVAAAWTVPSYALADVFGMADLREQIRADTESVARVIGRNEPSSPRSDQAAERLLGLFSNHQDPVAPVSLLYQNHDASSGLVRSAVLAAYTEVGPTDAGSTVRVATKDLTVGNVELGQGESVIIDLTNMRFGAGPHQCPGKELADSIVAGVLQALEDNRFQFSSALVDVDSNGFPIRFTMEAPQ